MSWMPPRRIALWIIFCCPFHSLSDASSFCFPVATDEFAIDSVEYPSLRASQPWLQEPIGQILRGRSLQYSMLHRFHGGALNLDNIVGTNASKYCSLINTEKETKWLILKNPDGSSNPWSYDSHSDIPECLCTVILSGYSFWVTETHYREFHSHLPRLVPCNSADVYFSYISWYFALCGLHGCHPDWCIYHIIQGGKNKKIQTGLPLLLLVQCRLLQGPLSSRISFACHNCHCLIGCQKWSTRGP